MPSRALQAEFGMSYLFISHDMAVVDNISDRVAVMYLGQIVELGSRAQIFSNSQHPYTRRLLDAVPLPDPRQKRRSLSRGTQEIHSPLHPPGHEPRRVLLQDIGEGHLVGMQTLRRLSEDSLSLLAKSAALELACNQTG